LLVGGEKTLNPKGWALFFFCLKWKGGEKEEFILIFFGFGVRVVRLGGPLLTKKSQLCVIAYRCGRAYLSKPPPKIG